MVQSGPSPPMPGRGGEGGDARTHRAGPGMLRAGGLILTSRTLRTAYGIGSWLVTVAITLVGLAALSTSLAYILFFQIIRGSGPGNVMLVTLLVPVTAILLGYVVLDEVVTTREIIGALIIASGLLIMDGRLLSRFASVPASR